MRTNHFVYLFTLLSVVACNRNQTTIRGEVRGGTGHAIVLERLDVNRTTFVDSTTVGKGGDFKFSADLEGPELYLLRYENGEIINLLPSPGEQIKVSATAESFGTAYSVEGSDESENIRILVEQMASTRTTIDSLLEVAGSIEDPESPHMELVRSAYTRAIVNQKRFTIRYLVEHISSLSSVYALYQKYDNESLVMGQESDLQYFKIVADSLELSYPNSTLTRSLRTDIERREADYRQRNQMSALLEMAGETTGLIDISIPDRDGKVIPLSSLKGKVVLVVFWASGNEESVNALLRLKPTYERYHGRGFEIYAVSLDNNRIRWMESMDYNEFEWINVSELSYPDSRSDRLYNVSVLPSVYLVNREGDIVAKNLFGKTLETWLDNLI
jgi:hypothetical protein